MYGVSQKIDNKLMYMMIRKGAAYIKMFCHMSGENDSRQQNDAKFKYSFHNFKEVTLH